jgi:putative ABC transport system ATP-binding protein
MILFENVSKVYSTARGDVRSLDQVDLEIKAGEFVSLQGPSGCGKTTLLLTVGGMLRPSSGEVRIADRELYALSARERTAFRASHIGFVFQMFHLVPYLSVFENVLLAAIRTAGDSSRDRAHQLLAELGLATRAQHKPAELSTGERQRTALARALLNEPKLILADEPTGNLDPENAAEVFRHLQRFHAAGGTVLVATHGTAGDACANRIIRMQSGSIQTTSNRSNPSSTKRTS